jgi:hypothetical protein
VLLVGHGSMRHALRVHFEGLTLEEVFAEEDTWQPGWTYTY